MAAPTRAAPLSLSDLRRWWRISPIRRRLGALPLLFPLLLGLGLAARAYFRTTVVTSASTAGPTSPANVSHAQVLSAATLTAAKESIMAARSLRGSRRLRKSRPPTAPLLEGELSGVLSDHDETPVNQQWDAAVAANSEMQQQRKGDGALGQPVQSQLALNPRVDPQQASILALTFNMAAAGRLWDDVVGCAKFREKHRALIERYSVGRWVDSQSLRRPVEADLQEGRLQCGVFKLRHVTVFVKSATWLVNWIDTTYSCACGITCLLTRSPDLASLPDAELVEGPHHPPTPRGRGGPLRVYLNLEVLKKEDDVDISVSYSPSANLQCTFAGNLFHIDRSRYVSGAKRQDVALFFAASNRSPVRENVARELLQVVRAHSVGAVQNNMEGVGELEMYPQCKHDADRGWATRTHCVQSHYKFALAVENRIAESYVTEKFYYPLEVGTVPVYFGAPDVDEFAPPDSYINAFGLDRSELQRAIQRANDDLVEYMGYHAWRRCGVLGNYSRARALSLDTLPCRLCEEISQRGGREAR